MPIVAGFDSSTQSCKLVLFDTESGQIVHTGRAAHPDGTEVDPEHWLRAAREVIAEVDWDAVAAWSVAGQQHGMVALDDAGRVIRPALLWNDTRSAAAADALIAEFGAEALARRTGSVPVASFTVTKLRWLRDAEPEHAARVHAVALPHDWLTWRLRGFGPADASSFGPNFDELVTDRSDASGTGYWSPASGEYDDELIIAALGHRPMLPHVLGPTESRPDQSGRPVGAGMGDNAGAALGLGLAPGDAVVSIGTSGTMFASHEVPSADASGTVAGFADAHGRFLPLVCTLNAARVLETIADLLAVSLDELSGLALTAEPDAGGLRFQPYFVGERTPNLPDATATLTGLTDRSTTRANLARAAVEGMLGGLAAGVDALRQVGVPVERLLLIGGGAQSPAVRAIAPEVFGLPVVVPDPAEYVALGAARQAALLTSH